MAQKSSFFIAGRHAVISALKNPKRRVLKVFLTEDSKKNIHKLNPNRNLLKDVKVFFKTKKELDKYCRSEDILHQGFVAEIEHLENLELKEFIKDKKNLTFVCLDEVTDPRNIGSLIIIPSKLNDAALLIIEPIFLGSETPSKQTNVKLFFFLINSFSSGFSKCSISATNP